MPALNSRFHRRYAQFTDQHGRKYGAVVESTSGHPAGPIEFKHRTPAGNLPPFLPSAKYLDFDPIEVGKVTVNYDAAIRDAERNVEDWERIIRSYALAMYADKAGEQIQNPGPGLLAIVGPKPKGADIIRAAKQGNKWALGFSDAMPAWAAPLMATIEPVRRVVEEKHYPDADDEGPKPTKGHRSAAQAA